MNPKVVRSLLIIAIIGVAGGAGFFSYKILQSGKSANTNVNSVNKSVANANIVALNTTNRVQTANTNTTVVNTNVVVANGNESLTTTCDYSVTKISVPVDENDIPLPAGWVHFTPNTSHFTVNVPASPMVIETQKLLPYPDDPYLISLYKTYPSPQTNGNLAYFMREENHCPDSVVKDANQYFQGRIKEVSGNFNYSNFTSEIGTYRGYPTLDYTFDTYERNKKYTPDQNQKFAWRIIVIGTTVFILEVRDRAATFNEAGSETFLNSFVPLIK